MSNSRYLLLKREILPVLNLKKGQGKCSYFQDKEEIFNKEANILQISNTQPELLSLQKLIQTG